MSVNSVYTMRLWRRKTIRSRTDRFRRNRNTRLLVRRSDAWKKWTRNWAFFCREHFVVRRPTTANVLHPIFQHFNFNVTGLAHADRFLDVRSWGSCAGLFGTWIVILHRQNVWKSTRMVSLCARQCKLWQYTGVVADNCLVVITGVQFTYVSRHRNRAVVSVKSSYSNTT